MNEGLDRVQMRGVTRVRVWLMNGAIFFSGAPR